MRRLNLVLLPCILALACTPGGGTTDGETSAGTSTSTSGPGQTVTSNGEPTTAGPSATATATTVEPGTTTTPQPTSDTEGTTNGPDATATTATTDDPPVVPCESDADCKLHSDCCACEGVPVGLTVAACEEECKAPLCQLFGVDEVVCRFGVCETERVSCDQSLAVCGGDSPECPDGQLPQVDMNCWTGECVPAALCDVVPDCGFCGEGMMCVQKTGRGVFPTVCEPIPVVCGGQPSCDCAGELVCMDAFPLCSQEGDKILCDCPNC